jgi:site-specific recombinase XerD
MDAAALERDVLSFYRHCRAGNLSPRTTQTYTESARQFAAYLVSQGMPTDLDAIRREHVEAFITDLLEKFKPATAHNRYRGVQAFFRWAVDEGLVKVSPMARMHPPKLPEEPVAVLSDTAIKALLAQVDHDTTFNGRRDAAIIRLFLDTGLRRAELAGLRWVSDDQRPDVDVDQGLLRVMGKGRRERVVPIGKKSVVVLDRYLRLRAKHPYASEPWLWLGQKGRLTDSGIAQVVRDRGAAAKLGEHIHPHQLRHTHVHLALSDGLQETDAMRTLGWKSRSMLQRYAASTGNERAVEAARKYRPGDKF